MKSNEMLCFLGLMLSFLVNNVSLAKDIYISPNGDDSVTYANNDINNPWKTVSKAFSSVTPGDNVYFRSGNYQINSSVETKKNTNPTSSSQRVSFSNYIGEVVTFTSTIEPAIYIDRDYYEVSGVKFTAPGRFWWVGNTYSATHFKISNCEGTVSIDGGAINYACVTFQSILANNGRVENCIFHGPGGGGNPNTVGVMIFRSQGIKVLNCEFYDLPEGIHYKHTCIPSNTGIEFAYNYFKDNGWGIDNSAQYSIVHNNLFVNGGYVSGIDSGTGDDGANAGSDHNTIQHNTFYNSRFVIMRQSSSDGSGAQYNIVKDNIFSINAEIFAWDANTYLHYTTTDYNLYPSGTSVINFNLTKTMAQFRSSNGQDQYSLSGSPVYVGGSTFNSISEYSLDDSSPGYRSASDGKDIGASIRSVGIMHGPNIKQIQ